MKFSIHKSQERKVSELNDAIIRHSFNYGQFFNPLREKFGVLRVLNDELLSPGYCSNERFHKFIEVLVLPLKGSISCTDATGSRGNADAGSALLISTGSGLSYSICNPSPDESAEVIEIWIFAHKNDRPTGIIELKTSKQNRTGKMQLIASGEKTDKEGAGLTFAHNALEVNAAPGLRLNQNALVWRVELGENESIGYSLKVPGNILLLFIIKGAVLINDTAEIVHEGDSVELNDIDSEVRIKATGDAELLIIEVPED